MSHKFGKRSSINLRQCHPDLQEILQEAIKYIDFSVICGHRSKADQDAAYHSGRSTKKFPDSKHNEFPSIAVDVAPYNGGIDWNDLESFAYLSGIIKGIAMAKGIKVRTGIDWDDDGQIHDHKLRDFPHIELVQ